jgi:hypothetical protein
MIQSVEEMYKSFLLGIKKEQSTIVPPVTFNLLINEEQDKWFKEKVPTGEIDQKRIDDLQILRTVTDGEYEYNGDILNSIGPDAYRGKVFSLPYDPDSDINNVWIGVPPAATTQNYPRYRRLLNIMFKIEYLNNECGLTGISDWLDTNIMRSDKRSEVMKNPYRKPKDNKLYYEIINNKIRLITNTGSYGYAMRIEYYRYPRTINFSTVLVDRVDCELAPEQQQEIVDRAVMTYIERSKNPRYQTAERENMKNQMNK